MEQSPGIIVLIPSSREFDRGLRRGIIAYAHAYGPWTFHEEPPPYLQCLTKRQRLRNMRGWNAQGMILLQSRLAEVRSLRIPTVVVMGTRRLGSAHYQVVCANEEIGRMGAETLIGLGLCNFAYCGLEGLEFSDKRGAGFMRAVQEAGHSAEVYSSPARNLGQSWYAEESRLAVWLSSLPKPTGLMACNDDRARMVAEICRVQKILVPDEIAILGVDNDEQVCKGSGPPLSSVELATERGGYEAAALLACLMSGRTPTSKVVTVHPTHAIARGSTDILAIEDPRMIRAVRFIRNNSHRNLRVANLTAAVGLSRRALQDVFKKHLDRTPMEEIRRCRVERLTRLLVGTNMTVGEIAAASGFEADAHVARFFSRQIGMTPLAYRKKHRIS